MDRPGLLTRFRQDRPKLFHLTAALFIILVGMTVFKVMMATKKEVVRRDFRIPAPVVSVLKAEPSPRKVIVSGEGTVSPLRSIDLVPQVGGKVIYISPALVDGGEFTENDILLKIDPIDYELAVKSAKARVKDLESKLQMMAEEAEIAVEEWRLSRDEENAGSPPPLVAKIPQLAAAEAALEAGLADLEKAGLNLERTSLKAPFGGIVSRKNIDLGQFVPVGMSLGSIFSTEAAEISVPLATEELRWLSIPGFTGDEVEGSPAVVYAEIAGQALRWKATVMRAEGILDERTRMINVVVRIDQPYSARPPLAMGLFARVEIYGHEIENSLLIPRSAIHDNDSVWILEGKDRLRFRKIVLARYEGDRALISSGIEPGEKIILTPLRVVTDSMQVRLRGGKGPAKR
ncbi:MAG: efflux RND transporter periplasmic adaptor subunit [Candidatus Krumholzibacteria bacterium]|nr:efflux RND transporter periplasmic adaptor subunit [Candidatus Krumholzibacteria bacterium]